MIFQGRRNYPSPKNTVMKKLIYTSIVALLLAGSSMLKAQAWQDDYLGLPGDNLNLYAVMNLFQESETLEGFERSLNDPEKLINNLDLNGDGYVDYIFVNDYVYENVHNIVLRVALNQNEYQDVAVFVVEKFRNGSVSVQLIGDEALYGPNYIIEPNYAETPNPGYRGNVVRPQTTTVVRTVTYYEVATWPVIVYISRPIYRPWRSVWYWGYYPSYWSPWTAYYWHYYYGYHYHWHAHYYTYYRPWSYYRCGFYHNYYYTSVRRYSPVVVVNVNRGVYKTTYSRPETRREGEALYAKRNSSSGRVPSGTGRSEVTGRNSAGPETRDAGTRSVTAPRNTNSGATSRGDAVTRTQSENVRREGTPAAESRPTRTTTAPASAGTRREATASPARTEPRSSSGQVAGTPRRETSAAPARNESRTPSGQVNNAPRRETAPAAPRTENRNVSSERHRPAATTAPASSNRTSSRPAAVESSRPSRSESRPASTTRSSESRSSKNSGSAVKSSSNERSSGSATRSNSAPAKSSSSRETGSSRPAGR